MTSIPTPLHLVQTKHTHDCLAQRLKELAPVLYSCFPAYAADCGLDAAERAGMNYINRVQTGAACDLTNGAAYLRKIAFRAARRCQNEEPSIVATWIAVPKRQNQEEEPAVKHARLHAALTSLPQRQRQAVALRFMDGLSLRKIADEMDVTPQTVDQYIKRGLTSLQKVLSANMPDRAGAKAS